MGGTLVQLDGISVYELNSDGLVRLHRLEEIALTGSEMEAVDLGFVWPTSQLSTPAAARPFYNKLIGALAGAPRCSTLTSPAVAAPLLNSASSRKLPASVHDLDRPSREQSLQEQSQHLLRPLVRRSSPPQASASQETPMERAARERAEMAAKAELREAKKKEGWGLNLASLAPTPCETSYDCESPMVCCDLIFASICCSSGMLVGTPQGAVQGALIPIPVEAGDERMPPGNPGVRF